MAMRPVLIIAVMIVAAVPVVAEKGPTPEELEQDVIRYTALIQQEGHNAKYLNALGFAYFKLNRWQEALDAFSRAAAADPAYAITQNNVGTTYLRLQEYAKAEAAFRNALALDPKYVKAAYNLSVSLYRQKRYFDAYKAYRRAKAIDAEYVKSRMKESGAKEAIAQELEKDPDNESLRAMMKELDAHQ